MKIFALQKRRLFIPKNFFFTYYKLDQTDSKPFCQASIIIPCKKKFYAFKVNHHSKVALFSQKYNEDKLDIFTHQIIDEKGNGEWKSYQFYRNTGDKDLIKVLDLWQIEKGKMYINLDCEFKKQLENGRREETEENHNLIWNLVDGTARFSQFNIKEIHRLIIPGKYISPRQIKTLPVYYVDIEKEEVLGLRDEQVLGQELKEEEDQKMESQSFDLFSDFSYKIQLDGAYHLIKRTVVVDEEGAE